MVCLGAFIELLPSEWLVFTALTGCDSPLRVSLFFPMKGGVTLEWEGSR